MAAGETGQVGGGAGVRGGAAGSRLDRAHHNVMRYRLAVKFLLHLAIFVSAYSLAFLVRFDFAVPPAFRPVIAGTIPVMLLAKSTGFLSFGLFRGWWRYVSIRDVLPIVAGCTVGSVLFLVAAVFLPGPRMIPRSIYPLDWGITLLLVLGARFLIRTGRETFGRRRDDRARRVLIVGAGAAGQAIAREIRENPALGLLEVGFIDDDPSKVGARIAGLKVFGGHGRIEEVCRENGVDEIIVAIPSASPSRLRHVVNHCEKVSARFRILPGVGELIGGKVTVNALRDVALEDLLGRDPVRLDEPLLRERITGKVVMVTGAAGSIGSELCRQVARHSPALLVMFEIAESPLFDLEMEMGRLFPGVSLAAVVGDVCDPGAVREAISVRRPHVIYHAAAYKHVPLMELQPPEAVRNNVLGTRVLAAAAGDLGVPRFVLVSSDKAVRPTNVMGATKRVAELIVQGRNGRAGGTVFVSVRFGNVLGSAGSVIPIFRRQLETTGKLTVTHPDAMRYFMLIPEAAGLILQAGAMGDGGEVFVLDMGEPVRILDLAMDVIRLSGKEPGAEAEIVFTGLRPGEKLREELAVEGEDVIPTSHPGVMKMVGESPVTDGWLEGLDRLLLAASLRDRASVVRELSALVAEYRPDRAFHGLPAEGAGAASPEPSVPAPPPGAIH